MSIDLAEYLPEHGTSADFAEAADLVDKLGQATTKGQMLSLVLDYRKKIRSAAIPHIAEAIANATDDRYVRGIIARLRKSVRAQQRHILDLQEQLTKALKP